MKLPNINSSEFAEFYGIMLGDGCVYSNLNGVCISGNSQLDHLYLRVYVKELIRKLFDIEPRIYYSKKEKSIRCIIYNRDVSRFLINFGFPHGIKKTQNLEIPKNFFSNKDLLKACIRGLQDTDGSLYPQSNVKIILDISIKTKSLLESTKKAFKKIGFKINFTHNRIYLCGKERISLFIQEMGSSNMRNIMKYNTFLETGKVPLSLETEKLLRRNNKKDFKLPYHGPVV